MRVRGRQRELTLHAKKRCRSVERNQAAATQARHSEQVNDLWKNQKAAESGGEGTFFLINHSVLVYSLNFTRV